ncbi:MAG: 50S ribosomal protein L25 [Phycisphaerales bacterium]|jgi:large subunit ribosomal protein L25|nr:50S ribosomal protein L25 [Phycisphaerales bacterium]
MSQDTPQVKVELREKVGTRYAQRLRKNGRLPASIYGSGSDPVSVSVDEKEIINHLQHGSHVMELDNGDGSPATVLVKDLQFGYLGDNLIHIDFARVNLSQIVTINTKLEINGKPTNASESGAMLEIVRPEIEIECMVKDIPSTISVDLSTVEEVFTIGDLVLPDGVKATLDEARHIAHVTFVQEEIEEVEGDVEGSEESTPEVIGDSDAPSEETNEGEGE